MTCVCENKVNLSLVPFLLIRKASICVTLLSTSLLVYTQNASSQVVFRAGPQFGTAFPNLVPNQSAEFGNTIKCPVASFNVSAFGRSGEDFARISGPTSSSRGIHDFGGIVGLNIPLSGSIGKFCKEYSKNQAAFEFTRRENQLRNSQLVLIQQCYWLKTSGFLNDDNKEVFKTNEAFSSLLPCYDVSLDRSTASIMNPIGSDPPKGDVQPSQTPAETIIERQR